MTNNDIVALIITGSLGLILVIMAIVLLLGKGAFLIAGFNTMSESEKKKYDTKALCRFMGKVLLPIGILMPSVAIGEIINIPWISGAYTGVVVILSLFAVIYSNTGNRFRK